MIVIYYSLSCLKELATSPLQGEDLNQIQIQN